MNRRDRAIAAAKKILGDETYVAMRKVNINTIEIIKVAAKEAFIHNLQGEHVEDLRRALKQLERDGVL